MGLSFTKKGVSSPVQNPGAQAPQTAQQPKKSVVSFLKVGAAAKAAVANEQAKAEAKQAQYGKMRRFWMPYNKDGSVTFLDGDLDSDGILVAPRYYEHRIRVGGDYQNYVCTAEIDQSQPCPLCEAGDKASLVGVLTVIDHSSYTVQKGPNAGKTYKNQRRLFVAKEGTLNQLQKLAQKPERNGLTLCTFDVSRGPENKHPPAVGDTFDFSQKWKSREDLAETLELDIEGVQPAVYEGEDGEISYLTPEQLIALGVGKAHGGVGYEKGISHAKDEL